MVNLNRRELLQHTGALGFGALFFPSLGTVARGEVSKDVSTPSDRIIFETIEAGGIAHYSYFLGDTRAGVAAVIDPRRDVDVYIDLANKHGLTITHAIETHVHADFVSGARELAARTKTAKICASVEGGAEYGFKIDQPLKDGHELTVGGIVLRAIHTPGHTPEHMSYLALSKEGGRPWALFTGDFLFVGSVGRPDLMGVENTQDLAKALFRSVQTAFVELPDQLKIYPAHGPGSPCGAGIQAPEGDPTLGKQRKGNPYWRMDDQGMFIETLLRAQPPVPDYYPRMKTINARGPEVLGKRPSPRLLKPDDFHKFTRSKEVQLLDTRLPINFAGAYIPGSLNMGYSESISMWGGWMLDPDRPIALVKPSQGTVEAPVDWLARVGLTNVEVALDGTGLRDWMSAGKRFGSFPLMSVQDVKRTFPTDRMQLLDCRMPSEWDMGHFPGAQYMFLPEIPKRMHELDKSKPVVAYCGSGYRASIAASILNAAGFDARNVPGSMNAWTALGYPVVIKPSSPGRASDTTRRA